MRYYIFFVFMTMFSNSIKAQDIVVFDNYSTLENAILKEENTVYVVNFWATWCAPCVQELPYFEKLNEANKQLKMVLVSLDFKNQYKSKLMPFLKNNSIQSEVVMLVDKDYNTWLPEVDKDWSGSIPATLIIKNGKKYFVEKSFSSYEELNQYVNSIIN